MAGNSLSALLRSERQRRGMTQEELAVAVGCAAETVRSWEAGRRAPSGELLGRLGQIFPDLCPLPATEAVAADGQALALRQEEDVRLAEEPVSLATAELSELDELRQQVQELRAEKEKLSLLVRVDPGTDVPNKRAVDEALVKSLRAAYRGGESVAVLFLDLDHFKALNTAHGHPACNEFLKHFAASMSGLVRDGDTFGRFGGEEFCAVLKNATLPQARTIAERMRARTAELSVDGVGTTVSIGVAALQVPRRAPEEGEVEGLAQRLLRDANEAQAWAKADGRNRVEVHSAERGAARGARGELVLVGAAPPGQAPAGARPRPVRRFLGGGRVATMAACVALLSSPSCCSEMGCPRGSVPVNGRCVPIGSECPDGSCIDR